MAELRESIVATLAPFVATAKQVEKDLPGCPWEWGVRVADTHDIVKTSDGKVAVAVGPGLPIPVSGSVEFGEHREQRSSSSLQWYFLVSSAVAPSVDPAPGSFPTTPIQPTLPGTTDGTPTQPLNVGGDPAQG